MIAPVFKSPGSKSRIAHEIVSLMPRHRVYLEPFAGSLAVLFSKPPSPVETVNDADGEICNLFRVLRDSAARESLIEAVQLTPYAEAELRDACGPDTDLHAVERARRLIVRSWMNMGSRQIHTAHFAYARARSGGSSGRTWTRLPSRIAVAGERLREVQVLNRDAVEVIEAHASEEVLVYADPPYPRSTRPGAGRLYAHEMDDGQHAELLAALKAHPGPVLLSGYECPLYEGMLGNAWRRVYLRGHAQSHETTAEVLFLNPKAALSVPNTLFD